MTPPRAIIFDWDNTLVDSWDAIHHALVVTFTAMGHAPWSLAETKARVRLSLRDAFPAPLRRRAGTRRASSISTPSPRPISSASRRPPAPPTLLDALQARGHYLAVVSNKTGPVLRREAAHLGWTRLLRPAGRRRRCRRRQAAMPRRSHLALDGSGIAAGDAVWYVGDTALDMECAANAGCVGVLSARPIAADPGFARFPPALQFPAAPRCRAISRACDFPFGCQSCYMWCERATLPPASLALPHGDVMPRGFF